MSPLETPVASEYRDECVFAGREINRLSLISIDPVALDHDLVMTRCNIAM